MKRTLMVSLALVLILTTIVPAVLAAPQVDNSAGLAAEKCKTYSKIKFCWKGQITKKGEVQICGQVENLGWKCKTVADDTTTVVENFCAHMNPSYQKGSKFKNLGFDAQLCVRDYKASPKNGVSFTLKARYCLGLGVKVCDWVGESKISLKP